MYDYSEQIESFREENVRLNNKLKRKLYDHRKANRDRLISHLPDRIEGLEVSESSFKPQGSMAVNTIIQTKFKYEEYDIDDGLVLLKAELIDGDGNELTSDHVREHVLNVLKDKRFVKQPKLVTNAVRVFYKEENDERHHIDIPVYRKFDNEDGKTVRELAGEDGWVESDPTQVNKWFEEQVTERNKQIDGKGTQFRHLIQLLKRFCRSRNNWDMPSGMKLTMLVAECQPPYNDRIDETFRELLERFQDRLSNDKVIRNLAHPDQPDLTRGSSDSDVEELENKVEDALEELRALDDPDNHNERAASKAWDWIFQSEGYFREYDKKNRLSEAARLINTGAARTTGIGLISATTGIPNQPHSFYGEMF